MAQIRPRILTNFSPQPVSRQFPLRFRRTVYFRRKRQHRGRNRCQIRPSIQHLDENSLDERKTGWFLYHSLRRQQNLRPRRSQRHRSLIFHGMLLHGRRPMALCRFFTHGYLRPRLHCAWKFTLRLRRFQGRKIFKFVLRLQSST